MYYTGILYLSFVSVILWLSMVCIGNLSELFRMLKGRLVNCICAGGVFRELDSVMGVIVWLSVIYLGLRVRGMGCVLQGVGQS